MSDATVEARRLLAEYKKWRVSDDDALARALPLLAQLCDENDQWESKVQGMEKAVSEMHDATLTLEKEVERLRKALEVVRPWVDKLVNEGTLDHPVDVSAVKTFRRALAATRSGPPAEPRKTKAELVQEAKGSMSGSKLTVAQHVAWKDKSPPAEEPK